ncbi:hypothetical protein [Yoonia sp. BS5-3]|uniref:Uncharacterized protein n=1 Tax=Yoonia phaeophyticola TaxID=3137369 RepID=A0ABZ2V012_9RHOB
MKISLKYDGKLAEDHVLDFYDAAQGQVGFQRSLAITTHYAINGEVITQAPSLKGADLLVSVPREGSWEIAVFVGAALYSFGTARPDTPIGHLAFSIYDMAIKKITGQHVDIEKSLGEQFEDFNKKLPQDQRIQPPPLDIKRFDSLLEKIEPSVIDMHRPIIRSKTAESALLIPETEFIEETRIDAGTYDFLIHRDKDDTPITTVGKVSSYNINTFKGRIYLPDERRPIPFELLERARSATNVSSVIGSMRANATAKMSDNADVEIEAFASRSRTGRTTRLDILDVSAAPEQQNYL